MNCDVCGASGEFYTDAKGNILLGLCSTHAMLMEVTPVKTVSDACRACRNWGKCCRTMREG